MSNVIIDKDKIDLLANAISAKSGEPLTMTLDEMVEAVDGIETGGVAPTGNIDITHSGQTDVTDYATATVPDADVVAGFSNSFITQNNVRKWKLTSTAYAEEAGWVDEGGIDANDTIYNAVPSNTSINPSSNVQTVGGATYMMEGAVSIAPVVCDNLNPENIKSGVTIGVGYPNDHDGIYSVTGTYEGDQPIKTAVATATPQNTNELRFTNILGEPTSFAIMSSGNISVPSGDNPIIASVSWDGTLDQDDNPACVGQCIAPTSDQVRSYNLFEIYYLPEDNQFVVYSTASGFFATSNQYKLVYSYDGSASNIDSKDVQVGSGATSITFTGLEAEPIYWACIFKGSFGTSNGYQRTICVVNDGSSIYGMEMDSSAKVAQHWTASYNNGSLTITSNGTNQGGYFHQPNSYHLTYAYDDTFQSKSATYTPTTSQQTATITPDSGYQGLKKVDVTVDPIPSQYIVPSGNLPITSNSNSIDVSQYATVSVNVPTSGSSKNVQIASGVNRVSTTDYTAVSGQSLTVSKTGTYDVYWTGYRSSTSGTSGSQLYIGNTAYGTAQTSFSNNAQSVHLSNVSLTANQTITVRARARGTNYYMYVGNLTIIEA